MVSGQKAQDFVYSIYVRVSVFAFEECDQFTVACNLPPYKIKKITLFISMINMLNLFQLMY